MQFIHQPAAGGHGSRGARRRGAGDKVRRIVPFERASPWHNRLSVLIGPDGKVVKHWRRVAKAADHPQKVLKALQQA